MSLVLPVANERGEWLLRLRVDAGAAAVPVRFALVRATGPGGVLLVRNRKRGVWELPGGLVDRGESAARCAARELFEESGQVAARLRWRALLELDVPDGRGRRRVDSGALFAADLHAVAAYRPGAEIEAIGFWPAAEPPGDVSAIDAALMRHCG